MSKFNTKDFMKNPVGAARDAAHAALSEFRKNPKPIGF
jgi:pantoate kinase